MRESIVIGDQHGCRKEFNQLLDKLNYDPKKHRIILVGDAIDRGPDPIGLLHQVREMGLECVLANHEAKALRWRKHELRRKLTGEDNPMRRPNDKTREEWKALTQEDLDWISKLPLTINAKDNWWVLHAGLETSRPFEDQDTETMIRVRYLNKKGSSVPLRPNKDQPEGAVFWTEMWDGKQSIVYGHCRQPNGEPRITERPNGVKCIGIDGGCVYGGRLISFNVDQNKFVSVKAEKAYYQPK